MPSVCLCCSWSLVSWYISQAVGLKQGCGADFLISIGLTLLGHIPGIGYAWYIIYKHRDDPNLSHRHGRTYVAVPQQQQQPQPQPQHYHATAPVN
ncbi:hypothetical protein BGX24_003302 [Mortierella sp. AD032]|nr:hypothetical protein BGX24_003302 [Mortierella sp. AD032]